MTDFADCGCAWTLSVDGFTPVLSRTCPLHRNYEIQCPQCGGKGKLSEPVIAQATGGPVMTDVCPNCQGKGWTETSLQT